jgi:hypothetical protein
MKGAALAVALALIPLAAAAEDTTAVTVGKITYQIPKNYIGNVDAKQITYPDCVAGRNCQHFAITLHDSSAAPPGKEWFEAGLKALEAMKKGKLDPQAGPAGYQLYTLTIKPTQSNAYASEGSINLYANEDLGIYFGCMGVQVMMVCSDSISLTDGNTASIRLQLPQVEELPDIEAGVRKFIATFPTTKEEK